MLGSSQHGILKLVESCSPFLRYPFEVTGISGLKLQAYRVLCLDLIFVFLIIKDLSALIVGCLLLPTRKGYLRTNFQAPARCEKLRQVMAPEPVGVGEPTTTTPRKPEISFKELVHEMPLAEVGFHTIKHSFKVSLCVRLHARLCAAHARCGRMRYALQAIARSFHKFGLLLCCASEFKRATIPARYRAP